MLSPTRSGMFFCAYSSSQVLSSEDRRQILLNIADALEANENLIKEENEADVATAQQSGYEKPLISRLMLKFGKASFLKHCWSLVVILNFWFNVTCIAVFYRLNLSILITS